MKNILGVIFNKLVWVEDRLAFKLVCREWYYSTTKLPKPMVLFREPNAWQMTKGLCFGNMQDQDRWVYFKDCKFDLFYGCFTLDYDVDGNLEFDLIKYNRPVLFLKRILHPTKGFFNINKIVDGESFVYVGRGGIIENDGQMHPSAVIYTQSKNVEELDSIAISAFREAEEKVVSRHTANKKLKN